MTPCRSPGVCPQFLAETERAASSPQRRPCPESLPRLAEGAACGRSSFTAGGLAIWATPHTLARMSHLVAAGVLAGEEFWATAISGERWSMPAPPRDEYFSKARARGFRALRMGPRGQSPPTLLPGFRRAQPLLSVFFGLSRRDASLSCAGLPVSSWFETEPEVKAPA